MKFRLSVLPPSESSLFTARNSDLVKETEGEAMVHRGLAEIHMLDKQVCKMYHSVVSIFLIPSQCTYVQINSLNLQAKKLPSSTPRSRSNYVLLSIHSLSYLY